MTLKLGMHHWALKYYQVCSNDDPGLTLTFFTARSNLVDYAFVWEKGKTMDFSETIVVFDLKLATDDRSDRKFLFTSKLCPLEAVSHCPGVTVYLDPLGSLTPGGQDALGYRHLPGYLDPPSDKIYLIWYLARRYPNRGILTQSRTFKVLNQSEKHFQYVRWG